MEKQQLVVQSQYKRLIGEVEDVIATNELNREFSVLEQKRLFIPYRGTTLEINEATFKSAVSNEEGAYEFAYDVEEDKWFLGEDEVDLSTYGITVNGDKEGADEFFIFFFDGKITYDYLEHSTLFVDENNEFDYICFTAEKTVGFDINDRFIHIETDKLEINFKHAITFKIDVWNYHRQEIETNLILAKKVE